jgi:hypothetical protein
MQHDNDGGDCADNLYPFEGCDRLGIRSTSAPINVAPGFFSGTESTIAERSRQILAKLIVND